MNMHRKKLLSRAFAVVLSASMLTGNNFATAAAAIGEERSTAKQIKAAEEAALKEAIRDSDEMVAAYPNGRFNFLATQYETKEGQKYIEIGVMRQGGTEGEASVLFRAIDVTASYGDDYEIYTTNKKRRSKKVAKGENVSPLIESAYNEETDLSETDTADLVEEAVEKETAKAEKNASKKKESQDAVQEASEGETASVSEAASLKDVKASGLKDAKSKTSGVESDRKSWRTVASDSAEEAHVREQYDAFLSAVDASEKELTFADGEYIKYLYFFPKDDKVSEAEEQMVMALLQTDDKAPVGSSYSAYVNIKDNDGKEDLIYEFDKKEVTADKDKVSVTVRRTSGIGYHDSIYVGTGEGTANPGADYAAGLKKLDFYAGQTEQKVTIDILDNEYRESDRDFYLLITRDGEKYEDAGCHVTIKGNGKGTMKAQATEANAEKITAYGSKSATGEWRLSNNDFNLNGFSKTGSDGITANHTGGKKQPNTKDLTMYGVSTLKYDLQNTGSGRSWQWSEQKSKINLAWKYRWSFKEKWTVVHNEHEDNFYMNVNGQRTNGKVSKRAMSMNIPNHQWGGGFGMISEAGSGNNTNVTVSNFRLVLKQYSYQISASKDKFYTNTYTLSTKSNDFSAKSQKDITPTLALASVGSRVGNSTTSPNGNTKMYRSDALTFKLNNYDANKLSFDGIEASTDNKNFKKVSNNYDVVLNVSFFKNFDLYNNSRIYFRPVFSYKNANVKFTLENKNKGTYTNLTENFTTGSNPQLHIGDVIKNIQGKSGNAASYQPSFSFRTGSSESNVKTKGFTKAGSEGLTLDSGNSQGAVANYTIGAGAAFTEIQLSYANPSVTVQADMNTYRNTYANEIITVDGKEYKCDDQKTVDALHEAMDKLYKANKDAKIKLSFEYAFNKDYMNGQVKQDQDFGNPQSATLYIYTDKGTADKTETVKPTTSTRDGKTIYTFTYEGNWKAKGWVDGSVASVVINGQNGYTSQETELDFLSTSGSYVMAYDDAKNIMTDTGNQTMGSLKNPLIYKSLNPLSIYNFVAMPSSNFVARWGDYSLDTNNDGNISNASSDDEIKKAEKRLEELGQDKSLATKNAEVYFGNSFAYQPSVFADTKLYFDFVKKATSTGSNNRLGLQLMEEKATAIAPNKYTTSYLKGATVTVLGTEIMEEGTDGNYYITGAYEKGQNYLADVVYQGVHFQARCVGTRTVLEKIRTSDVMFPTNFDVQQNGKSTGVRANGGYEYLDILPAGNTTKFTFNFSSSVGVKPNKAKITFYDKDGKVLHTQTYTRANVNNNFACEVDLAKAGVKPGTNMVIQGIYNDGSRDYVYPEVDSGIIFKATLSVISVATSFKTPFNKTLKMFGKIGTRFDLPLDYDLASLGTKPVQYTDDNGASHSVTQIAFGYNTKVKDELNRLQTEHKAENKGNAMSGRGVATEYIESLMEDDDDDDDDEDEDYLGYFKEKADEAQDKNAAKSDNMKNTSFDYSFSVALILTVETGPSTNREQSGNNYFDSLMLVAAGEAQMKGSVVYTTPIGIDIIVTMEAGGKAAAAFAVGSSSKNPYSDAFNMNKDGDDKSFTLSKKDFDIYTKFLLAPTITLGAGVGLGGGKIASVTVSGTAAFDFKFTAPIIGTDTSAAGDGGVTLGADLKLKILFIKKSWNLYKSERMNLFSFGAQSINDMLSDFQENYLYDAVNAEDLETISRDYLKNSSKWQPYDVSAMQVEAGEETILKEGIYPYPDAKVLDLSGGKLLAVFLDDPGKEKKDAFNSSTVMYSYSKDKGLNWSEPVMVDDDKTRDEAPYVYQVTDKKALIVWSDASQELKDATSGEVLEKNLASLDISGAWFDVDTAKAGTPFTVASTEVSDRVDFQDAAPLVSYDEDTGKLMVYFTATDYQAETDTKVTTDDIDDATQKADAVTYGDIINGYSVIGVVSSSLQGDGSFSAFGEPEFIDLAVPYTVETTGDEKSLTGEGIADPKVVDSDVISYNGLSLYAYTIDQDQNDQTLDDRELFVQIYNFGKDEFHHPIQITSDNVSDSSPQFVRCKNMTYLYWISGGDVKYANITAMVRNLDAEDGNGYLKLVTVDNPWTEEEVNVYFLDASEEKVVETAVAHKEETDEEGNVTSQPITEFDVRSNGKTMYMLWTDMVTEQRDENGTGAGNIIKETQVFGAYCEPSMELKETEEVYTFEDVEGYISYQFKDGKGRDTYPESYKALQDIKEDGKVVVTAGTTVPIDYTTEEDINGEIGKVKAGDRAVRTIQTVVNNGGCGWSEPIQITRKTGEEYNYSDLSFRVTEDNGIQAIFSRGKQTLNPETGAFEVDESSRVLAVQNFTVTSTLENGEMTYRSVAEETTTGEETEEAAEEETKEEDVNTYCFPGDTVEFSVDVTNDGFEPLEDVTYRTYMTVDGKMKEDSSSDWQELAPTESIKSEIALDVYTEVTGDSDGENADEETSVETVSESVNRFIGGSTATLTGRAVLGDEIEGTAFVIELKYKDEKGAEKTKKITRDLLVESKVDITTVETELLDEDTARVVVNVANAGNQAYTGDIKLADGDTKAAGLDNVTIEGGSSQTYTLEADISDSSYGKLVTNEDGSKQDAISLDLTYGDDKETAAAGIAEVVRKTSVEGGYAVDAIQSIDIAASDATVEDAEKEKVGDSLEVPSNQTITLENVFHVDEDSAAAKALEKEGCSAEAQMVTEWSSSDSDVAYVSDKGLLIPMEEGEATITALIYPGQRVQTGQTDCSSGEISESDEAGFGKITSEAGTGSYATFNGRYLVPESLITKKTFKVKVGAAKETETPNPTPTPDGNTGNKDPGQTQAPAAPGNTEQPVSGTQKVTVGSVQYKVPVSGTSVTVVGGKKNLKTLTIPAAVQINGKKYKVTAIAAGAFKNQKKLTKVTIGKNVTKIGKKAFYGDKKLKQIIFKCKKVPTIGNKAFAGISKKAVYKVPAKHKKKYKKKLTKKTGFVKSQKIK